MASVSPSSGSLAGGTTITVTGTNLSGATVVKVGSANATSLVVVNDTTLTCVTPAGSAGAKSVSVTTPGGTATRSNAFTHVYVPPTIASVSPSAGPETGGTSITITGTNLLGATAVRVGGATASALVVVNATTLTCTTPAGTAGARDVQVTVPGGSVTSTGGFTYYALAGSLAGGGGAGWGPGLSADAKVDPAGGTPVDASGADGQGAGGDGSDGDDAGDGAEDADGKPEALPPIECEELSLRIEARIAELVLESTDESIRLAKRLMSLLPAGHGNGDAKPLADGHIAFDPACAMANGDVDLDGDVDADDLDAYFKAWDAGDEVMADLDRDGKITLEDLARVVREVGTRA